MIDEERKKEKKKRLAARAAFYAAASVEASVALGCLGYSGYIPKTASV
jgi:hypothetical protein